MPKVSVIVPVYNTEKYLEKCLLNIVNQTLDDIEVLVINDGSKDNSKYIIERFEKMYPQKIKAFSKKNEGVSITRNYGLSKATGDYISFVDSDDEIDVTMLEKLYNKAISENFDITIANVKLVYEESEKTEILNMPINEDTKEINKIKETMTYFYPILCDKIIKRDLIYNEYNCFLPFESGVWYEDTQWLLKIYPRIKSIGIVNEPLYYYLQRQGSITFTYNEKLYDIINNMDVIIDYYKKNDIYDEYEAELEFLYSRYAFATFIKRLSKCKNKKTFNEGVDYAIKKVNEAFPNYKNNKYLKQGFKGKYIKHFNKFISNITYLVESNINHN